MIFVSLADILAGMRRAGLYERAKDGIKKVVSGRGGRIVVKIDKLPAMQPHLITLPNRFLF